MAITFITGVMGSGKTYRSVFIIYLMYTLDLKPLNLFMQWFRYYFPLQLKKVYTFTYTNIDDFNFEYSKQIKPLIYVDLYSKLVLLYDMYSSDCGDSVLISKCKELSLYDSFFVIDEAHKFFSDDKDKVITWWFTYHRHLHQEIHLITQQMKLIAPKYKGLGQYFYKAYPSSKQLSSKNFRYSSHVCAGFHKLDAKVNIMIPSKQSVFNLYHSGKKEKRISVLKKFAYILPFGFFALFMTMYFFSNTFTASADVHSENNLSNIIEPDIVKNSTDSIDKISIDYKNTSFFSFNCIGSICKYNKTREIPLSFLLFLFENNDFIYAESRKVNFKYTIYDVLLPNELVEFLNRSVSSKKKKESNPISSSKLF